MRRARPPGGAEAQLPARVDEDERAARGVRESPPGTGQSGSFRYAERLGFGHALPQLIVQESDRITQYTTLC